VTRYISLAEYLWLAEQVTGVDAVVLAKAARTELADSALHAPQAAFAGHEFYVELGDKAAVLVCRLAWNHPLPDGNKRAAWAALVMFLDLNGANWTLILPTLTMPRRPCSPLPATTWTRPGPRSGSAPERVSPVADAAARVDRGPQRAATLGEVGHRGGDPGQL